MGSFISPNYYRSPIWLTWYAKLFYAILIVCPYYLASYASISVKLALEKSSEPGTSPARE